VGAPIGQCAIILCPCVVLGTEKTLTTFGNLYSRILLCGVAFSFRYFSSLDSLRGMYRTNMYHTLAAAVGRRNRRRKKLEAQLRTTCEAPCVVLGVSAQIGGGGGKRGPHSAQPVTSSCGRQGHRRRNRRPRRMGAFRSCMSLMQIVIGGGGQHACGTQSSHSEP